MGYRNSCCHCPEAWTEFIDRWVLIFLANDEDPLFDTPWQLRQVHDRYIVVRRRVADLGGWQRAVIPCQHIIGLMEATEI